MIVGIAVHYLIPWTYDLKPVVWLKELYVTEATRGMWSAMRLLNSFANTL
ncbi:hypothetical protein X749_23380 [Mesorhizobium sp. LNJC391B00]|nr:hypothetical protein X749_23380 [Mesorhizobium sp. LNJC391B00]